MVKGEKFKSFHEACDWIGETKPIWSNGDIFENDYVTHVCTLKAKWNEFHKAIPRPEPIVIEGKVDQLHINHKAICIRVIEGNAPSTIIGKKVSLTIHQGEE